MLLGELTVRLIETTASCHYERFRIKELSSIIGTEDDNFITSLEEMKKKESLDLQEREKLMEEMFEIKIAERLNKLESIKKMQEEEIVLEKKQLKTIKENLLDDRNIFEKEKNLWETQEYPFRSRGSKSTESLGKRKKFRFPLSSVTFGKY